jgi:glycopeptide antibiotics resistance protein
MASRDLHVIKVPRRVTVLLLLLVSALMLLQVWFLSGKAVYRAEASPGHLLHAMLQYDRTGAGRANLLASAAPAIAAALVFIPWGALAFLAFDRPDRAKAMTYALTLALGVTFALALSAWQEFLPTRITGWLDIVWNALGALSGAVLGLRKRVRVRFEA